MNRNNYFRKTKVLFGAMANQWEQVSLKLSSSLNTTNTRKFWPFHSRKLFQIAYILSCIRNLRAMPISFKEWARYCILFHVAALQNWYQFHRHRIKNLPTTEALWHNKDSSRIWKTWEFSNNRKKNNHMKYIIWNRLGSSCVTNVLIYINEKLLSVVLCLVEQVKQHNYFKYQMDCQICDLDQK